MPNIEEIKRELHEQIDKLTEESMFIFSTETHENGHLLRGKETVRASLADIMNMTCNIIRNSLVKMSADGEICADYAVRIGRAIDAACADAANEVFSKKPDDEKKAELLDLIEKAFGKRKGE